MVSKYKYRIRNLYNSVREVSMSTCSGTVANKDSHISLDIQSDKPQFSQGLKINLILVDWSVSLVWVTIRITDYGSLKLYGKIHIWVFLLIINDGANSSEQFYLLGVYIKAIIFTTIGLQHVLSVPIHLLPDLPLPFSETFSSLLSHILH